jgi:acyl-CoA reductase-like NAD-dependent aldehyde dehydrogenase
VFTKAGFPAGCLNVLYHRTADAPEITRSLIKDAAIRKVNFTGSTKVGRIVAELSGRFLKPCLLELGGKASAIVLEDADITQAAVECVKGAFFHVGHGPGARYWDQ